MHHFTAEELAHKAIDRLAASIRSALNLAPYNQACEKNYDHDEHRAELADVLFQEITRRHSEGQPIKAAEACLVGRLLYVRRTDVLQELDDDIHFFINHTAIEAFAKLVTVFSYVPLVLAREPALQAA